jgi:hypothetical protein
MVAAPLPNGRRSNSGECEQRRCWQMIGAATQRCLIERANDAAKCRSSPGACRACRRGLGWPESPATTVADVGEDDVVGDATDRLASIPFAG